jgi:hypothetical protein
MNLRVQSDYGVFAFGYTMNAKTSITKDRNKETYVVTRVSYPFVKAVRSSSLVFKHIQVNGLLEGNLSWCNC